MEEVVKATAEAKKREEDADKEVNVAREMVDELCAQGARSEG